MITIEELAQEYSNTDLNKNDFIKEFNINITIFKAIFLVNKIGISDIVLLKHFMFKKVDYFLYFQQIGPNVDNLWVELFTKTDINDPMFIPSLNKILKDFQSFGIKQRIDFKTEFNKIIKELK